MTPKEIRSRIDQNNNRIEQILNKEQFMLNLEIQQLMQDNEVLQRQCTHEFKNGQCIYCDLEEN